MGTRADFYIGTDENDTWLGSIGWDGYPDGISDGILKAKTKAAFITAVKRFFSKRDDVTLPDQGWPWPWEDSRTTDYAYAFSEKKKKTMVACFGRLYMTVPQYFKAGDDKYDSPKEQVFPNMKNRQNVAFGQRSGLIVISA